MEKLEFNLKLLLEDLENKNSFEKYIFLNELIESVKNEKMRLINKQDFENAAEMRDVERTLLKLSDEYREILILSSNLGKLTLEKYISKEKREL